MPYSRSSFERAGHEVGTLYRRAQARIEEVLIQEYAVPAEARSVSISIDRVALPMDDTEPILALDGTEATSVGANANYNFGMAIIIIDQRPYFGVTIQAGNDVIRADELDEKTLALAKQLDRLAAKEKAAAMTGAVRST